VGGSLNNVTVFLGLGMKFDIRASLMQLRRSRRSGWHSTVRAVLVEEVNCALHLVLSRDADLSGPASASLTVVSCTSAAGCRACTELASRPPHGGPLGHPEKRFEGIGTDRKADVTSRASSRLQLAVKICAVLPYANRTRHGGITGAHWARLSCECPFDL